MFRWRSSRGQKSNRLFRQYLVLTTGEQLTSHESLWGIASRLCQFTCLYAVDCSLEHENCPDGVSCKTSESSVISTQGIQLMQVFALASFDAALTRIGLEQAQRDAIIETSRCRNIAMIGLLNGR
jgi:hypothetical protein